MSVASPSVSNPTTSASLTDPVRLTVIPVKTDQQQKAGQRRGRLYNLMIEAGCEIIALVAQAGGALVKSREPDAIADQHIDSVRRIAVRGAEESAGVHGCECWRRFTSIDHHAAIAQAHDSLEDGLIAKATAAIGKIKLIARAMNVALSDEVKKRGWRR